MGRVITLRSCKPFSDARRSLFCYQVVRFRDNSRTSFGNFSRWCLFLMLCRFPSSRFIMHSQRNRINFSGQDWKERLFRLWENDWNTWRVERFCVFIVQKFLLFQPSNIKNFERKDPVFVQKRNRRLCVATSHLINELREQVFRLDTSQLVLIQFPIVH